MLPDIGRRQNNGAAFFAFNFRSKKITFEIEGCDSALGQETHAMLAGDVGETSGDIRAAVEDDPLDLGPDRGESGTRSVAAIEKRRTAPIGDRRAGRFDDRPEPAGPGIASGIGSAQDHYRTCRAHGGFQRAHRVRQRMDDDNDGTVSLLGAGLRRMVAFYERPQLNI